MWFTFRYKVLVAGRRSGHAESISLLRTGVSLDVSPCLQQRIGGWFMLTHLYQRVLMWGLFGRAVFLGWVEV